MQGDKKARHHVVRRDGCDRFQFTTRTPRLHCCEQGVGRRVVIVPGDNSDVVHEHFTSEQDMA